MTISSCSRDIKPDACRDFPQTPRMLEPFADKCGFWFDSDGVRHGKCNRCGACCKNTWLRLPEFDEKIRGFMCPYLVVNK